MHVRQSGSFESANNIYQCFFPASRLSLDELGESVNRKELFAALPFQDCIPDQ